jgi:hypothetical protein
MQLIDKIGKSVYLNKNNYDYECQYVWAVFFRISLMMIISLFAMLAIGIVPYVVFGTFFCIPAYIMYAMMFLFMFEEQLHVMEFLFTTANRIFDFVMSRVFRVVNEIASAADKCFTATDNTVKICMKKYCKPIIKEEEK